MLVYYKNPLKACVMAKAVSWWPLTMMVHVPSQTSSCGIWGGQSDAGKNFSFATSFVVCKYHSINGPCSNIDI